MTNITPMIIIPIPTNLVKPTFHLLGSTLSHYLLQTLSMKRFLSVERFDLGMSEKNEIAVEDIVEGEDIGLKVADWLAEKENIPDGMVEGEVETITEKAVLIDDDWVPKSQVEEAWLR